MFKSFQAGYLKRLDWRFYTSLSNPLSKRMYRFLDKRFYHSQSFEMDLFDFGVNRMGLSSNYNSTQLKRALAIGFKELEQRWELKPLRDDGRYQKQGRGQWSIRLERKKKQGTANRPNTISTNPVATFDSPIDNAQLQTALVKRGVGPAAAEEIACGYPVNSIKTMIELFDWYNGRGQPRGAGFLVQAIRKSETIELPKGFESSRQLQLRRDSENQRQKNQQEHATRRQRLAAKRDQSRFDAFANYWQSLSQEDQTQFEDQAIDKADPTKRMGYYRHQGREGPLFEEYRQVILRDHFERGGSSLFAPRK